MDGVLDVASNMANDAVNAASLLHRTLSRVCWLCFRVRNASTLRHRKRGTAASKIRQSESGGETGGAKEIIDLHTVFPPGTYCGEGPKPVRIGGSWRTTWLEFR